MVSGAYGLYRVKGGLGFFYIGLRVFRVYIGSRGLRA